MTWRRFLRGCWRGRPLYCARCKQRFLIGEWTQPTPRPYLPWHRWSHRGGCRGRYRTARDQMERFESAGRVIL